MPLLIAGMIVVQELKSNAEVDSMAAACIWFL